MIPFEPDTVYAVVGKSHPQCVHTFLPFSIPAADPSTQQLIRINMQININGQPQSLADASSIDTLLEQLDIAKTGIAVAINEQVIPKNNWGNQQLQANDNVLIIKATQGG